MPTPGDLMAVRRTSLLTATAAAGFGLSLVTGPTSALADVTTTPSPTASSSVDTAEPAPADPVSTDPVSTDPVSTDPV
ncbi:MAG: hypothetical protein H7233_02145, partial [Pseudorhodobacter sp.]|nr:hypothetical protein [Frankiaceae bacterium]